ncbi:MAG: regulatory protein RecX [Lachnospiraceae bacterium]|nr:regulatory protein RecX [Lachnospiraceae bacterium]
MQRKNKSAEACAMDLLLKQNRTEQSLRKKLLETGYTEEEASTGIDYVKRFGYLDDRRFAASYIRSISGRYSLSVLKRKLSEKGVSPEDIDAAVEEAFEEGSLNEEGEEELIEKLIRKKYPDGILPDENAKNKLFASLYRKGFAVRDVEKVLRRILT